MLIAPRCSHQTPNVHLALSTDSDLSLPLVCALHAAVSGIVTHIHMYGCPSEASVALARALAADVQWVNS